MYIKAVLGAVLLTGYTYRRFSEVYMFHACIMELNIVPESYQIFPGKIITLPLERNADACAIIPDETINTSKLSNHKGVSMVCNIICASHLSGKTFLNIKRTSLTPLQWHQKLANHLVDRLNPSLRAVSFLQYSSIGKN